MTIREAQEKVVGGLSNPTATVEPNAVANRRERARRFCVQLPMHYRVSGENRWWKGRTENVSRSGVLFRGELTASPNTTIEMSMVLPSGISGNGAAEVFCRGTIVRVEAAPTAESLPVLATTISHYRLVRP